MCSVVHSGHCDDDKFMDSVARAAITMPDVNGPCKDRSRRLYGRRPPSSLHSYQLVHTTKMSREFGERSWVYKFGLDVLLSHLYPSLLR